jgi:hypothetical protein
MLVSKKINITLICDFFAKNTSRWFTHPYVPTIFSIVGTMAAAYSFLYFQKIHDAVFPQTTSFTLCVKYLMDMF